MEQYYRWNRFVKHVLLVSMTTPTLLKVAKLQRKQEVYECLRKAEEQLKGQ